MACQLAPPPKVLSHGAETFGDLYAKTMQCQSKDDGRFALTHFPMQVEDGVAKGAPVLMTSGMFTGRGFWVSPKGLGIAAELAKKGFEVYIYERRGVGESPRDYLQKDQARAGLNEAILYDLPAIQGLIAQRNSQPLFMMGHSFGGVALAAALATNHMNRGGINGLVLFGSQLTVDKPFLNPPWSVIPKLSSKALGYFPSKKLKMGPFNESPAAMQDAVNWVSAAKARGDFVFWEGFNKLHMPVLAISGSKDDVDPAEGVEYLMNQFASKDKTFTLLSKANGNLKDYDHVGMVVSKEAAQEVWPMVAEWMLSRKVK
ncbi:MAG: alpha/beta fold hydrolase [Gammaproteobacteria bacterium]|nr:alpha/beta fold hydrolase [Gammaproteobacteria bacterium]